MIRAILFTHRWLGVVIGALMTLWCLSGFVMMYSDYPRLTGQEQLRGLPPLRLPAAAVWNRMPVAADATLASIRVEMMADRPVLRISPAGPPLPAIAQMRASPGAILVDSGMPLPEVDAQEALAIGTAFGRHFGIQGAPVAASPVEVDQWNVQTFRRHAPLRRIDYPGGETAYVAASGEVVQQTTRAERVLGWLGAVPHWLYPTLLRQDGALWMQVVVWTALLGCFLTVTGIVVGIVRLRRGRDGRIGSPMQGLWWWHHMLGLFFGILTLTWVMSGLFTMNPWGFLDSEAGFAECDRLQGGPVRWQAVAAALGNMTTLPPGTVRVEAAPLGGRLFLVVSLWDGRQLRFGADGRPAPLARAELAAALADGPPVASLQRLGQEDSYYYAHRNPAPLPVWRAILRDTEQTRLYIDPASGRLVRAVDGVGRQSRWLRNGLHSLDLPGLRTRPLWDLIVLPLLLLVTAVCVTGTWMAYDKIKRDLKRSRNRRCRRRREAARAPAAV